MDIEIARGKRVSFSVFSVPCCRPFSRLRAAYAEHDAAARKKGKSDVQRNLSSQYRFKRADHYTFQVPRGAGDRLCADEGTGSLSFFISDVRVE